MNHDTVLALVSAIWVSLELMVGIISRRFGVAPSAHDRGSYHVLWLTIMAATITAGIFHHRRLGHIPNVFWLGITLILVGIAIRATAILTLRRYFTVQVTIQQQHELIDRGLYRIIRHPSHPRALVPFIGLGCAFGNCRNLALILVGALIGFAYRVGVD